MGIKTLPKRGEDTETLETIGCFFCTLIIWTLTTEDPKHLFCFKVWNMDYRCYPPTTLLSVVTAQYQSTVVGFVSKQGIDGP